MVRNGNAVYKQRLVSSVTNTLVNLKMMYTEPYLAFWQECPLQVPDPSRLLQGISIYEAA